jgi:glycerate-2-kinase
MFCFFTELKLTLKREDRTSYLIKNPPKRVRTKEANVVLEGGKKITHLNNVRKILATLNKVKLMSHIKSIHFSQFFVSQVLCIYG